MINYKKEAESLYKESKKLSLALIDEYFKRETRNPLFRAVCRELLLMFHNDKFFSAISKYDIPLNKSNLYAHRRYMENTHIQEHKKLLTLKSSTS